METEEPEESAFTAFPIEDADEAPVEKPKKKLTTSQLEGLKRGREKQAITKAHIKKEKLKEHYYNLAMNPPSTPPPSPPAPPTKSKKKRQVIVIQSDSDSDDDDTPQIIIRHKKKSVTPKEVVKEPPKIELPPLPPIFEPAPFRLMRR